MRIVQGITGKHFLTDRMVQLPKAISSGQRLYQIHTMKFNSDLQIC